MTRLNRQLQRTPETRLREDLSTVLVLYVRRETLTLSFLFKIIHPCLWSVDVPSQHNSNYVFFSVVAGSRFDLHTGKGKKNNNSKSLGFFHHFLPPLFLDAGGDGWLAGVRMYLELCVLRLCVDGCRSVIGGICEPVCHCVFWFSTFYCTLASTASARGCSH